VIYTSFNMIWLLLKRQLKESPAIHGVAPAVTSPGSREDYNNMTYARRCVVMEIIKAETDYVSHLLDVVQVKQSFTDLQMTIIILILKHSVYVCSIQRGIHTLLFQTQWYWYRQSCFSSRCRTSLEYSLSKCHLSQLFASFKTSAEDGALSTELSGSCSNCIWPTQAARGLE